MADYINLHSPLVDHPDYLRAIGELSVEISNLELGFSRLLALVLRINPSVGEAIYFSPKATIARLDILENVVTRLYPDKANSHRKTILKFIKRGAAVFGKRHIVVHQHWGIHSESGKPVAIARPSDQPATPFELSKIEAYVTDCRSVMSDVFHYVETMKELLRQKASEETPPEGPTAPSSPVYGGSAGE